MAINYPTVTGYIIEPSIAFISSITNANPMVVTTRSNHTFEVGLDVRFIIPHSYGMQQLNKKHGTITAITDDTFTINMDSSLFDTFAVNPQELQPAQVIPVGTLGTAHKTIVFENVS